MIMCRFYNYTQTVGAHRGADCIAQQGACFVLITSVAVGLNSTRGPLCTGAAVRSHLPPTVSHFSHPVSSSPRCVPRLFLSYLPLVLLPIARALFSCRATAPMRALLRHPLWDRGPGTRVPTNHVRFGMRCSVTSEAPDDERGAAKQRDGKAATLLWIAAAVIMFWGRIRAIKLYLLSSCSLWCIWKSNVYVSLFGGVTCHQARYLISWKQMIKAQRTRCHLSHGDVETPLPYFHYLEISKRVNARKENPWHFF